MTEAVYKEIWNKIILKEKKSFTEKINIIKESPLIKKPIYQKYQELREKVRSDWIKNPSDHRLDRHKICSLLAHSILSISPFEDINEGETYYQKYPNEFFAYTVSLRIMFDFNFQLGEQYGEPLRQKAFQTINNIELPPVRILNVTSSTNYLDYLLKLLKKIRIEMGSDLNFPISIRFLSHLFFFIENYHREFFKKIENEATRHI